MSKATDEQVEAAALVIAGNVTPAQMAANPEEAKFARETALAALTAAAALEDVSSIHEAEPVDGKSSPEVKAICDTLDFLRRGKHEPYWLNARDGIALMSPLLRAATKLDKLERAAHPAPISKGVTVKAFQDRVAEAHHALFHDDPTDLSERRDRFYEEATETAQALGMTEADAHALVSYTFSRPIGEPEKEIGAAALTLASLCVVGGWDMMACAEADLAKLQQPATIERIRTKRLTRHGRGPLPGLSHTAGEP